MMTDQVTGDVEPKAKTDEPIKPQTVSKVAYDEVSADLHKFKEQVRTFEADKAKADDATLVQNSEWQKAYEAEKSKREDLEVREKKLEQSFVRNEKLSAIEREAVRLGIRKESLSDLGFFPFDDVQIQKTVREDGTSDLSVIGAADAMERFKLTRPTWFGPVGTLNTNMNDPEVVKVTATSTVDAIAKAHHEGDIVKYNQLMADYRKQRS